MTSDSLVRELASTLPVVELTFLGKKKLYCPLCKTWGKNIKMADFKHKDTCVWLRSLKYAAGQS